MWQCSLWELDLIATSRGLVARRDLEANAAIAWRAHMAGREKRYPPWSEFAKVIGAGAPETGGKKKLPAGPRVQAPDMGQRIKAALTIYQAQENARQAIADRKASRQAAQPEG